jgi:hypothetical protein
MTTTRGVAAAILGLLLQLSALSGAIAAESATPDDLARFLAGMAPSEGSPLQRLTKHTAWQDYARRAEVSWKDLESRQLGKIRDWTKAALPNRKPVVFYMFSGPDFLYADALLPGASTYVLSGLEPVGRTPMLEGLQRASLHGEFAMIESSLNSVFSYSFFRTKEMKVKLVRRQLEGTLPLLLLFMARSDKVVHEIELVGLDNEGNLEPAGEPGLPKTALGVKIVFSAAGSDDKRTLYYFNTNLDNGGLKASGFLAFCSKLGVGDSLVKSASYLMHQSNFSKVRDFLLANSATLVEDDSGIPVHFFEPKQWRLQPYGSYFKPIELFPGRYQGQLRSVFAKDRQPLPFGIGYRWHSKESNLLVAMRLAQ